MIKDAWVLSLYSSESHYNSLSIRGALKARNISSTHVMVRNLTKYNGKFYHYDKPINTPDIIYAVNQYFYREDRPNEIVQRLIDIERSGIPCTNPISATFKATNKWLAYNILKNNNILTPDTILIDKHTVYDGSIVSRLGAPFVVKLIMGSNGNRYRLCYSEEELKVLYERYSRIYGDDELIAQKYLDTTAGMIVTVGVVKDLCCKAVIRLGDPHSELDFLNDTEANRTQIAFKVDSKLEQTVNAVMNAFNLDSARIDTMIYDNEYYVLEANPPGGLNITDLMHNYKIANDIVERSIRRYG